jgi:hypothetical protein
MTAEEELARGSRRSSFRRPWVKKKGRVRLLLLREVHLCRERGQRRSRSTVYRPPSLQIENEVSSPPPLLQAKGWLLVLWESEVVLGE